jgi:hypothetical protein
VDDADADRSREAIEGGPFGLSDSHTKGRHPATTALAAGGHDRGPFAIEESSRPCQLGLDHGISVGAKERII